MVSSFLLLACVFLLFAFFRVKAGAIKAILLLCSVVVFSGGPLFNLSPQIAAMHIALYGFFLYCIFVTPADSLALIASMPLKKYFLILFLAYLISGVEGFVGGVKGAYDATRQYLDSFSMFFAAYLICTKCSYEELTDKLFWPVIAFCGLGFLEALLQNNFIYLALVRAFPAYNGDCDPLNKSLFFGDPWRMRISITTWHPSTLGLLLSSIFLFYWPKYLSGTENRMKTIILLCVVGLTIFLSGSRTAMLCTCFFAVYLWIREKHFYFKILFAIVAIFCILEYSLQFIHFMENSGGSSISLRQRNMLVCLAAFSEHPVIGHGLGYTSTLVEKDADGGNVDGAFESVIYHLLIDQGLLGLIVFFIFFGAIIFYFCKSMRKDNRIEAMAGTAITGSALFFSLLSGFLGRSDTMTFFFIGACAAFLNQDGDAENTEEPLLKKEKD